jgi:predicted phosphoribosyltransferase
LSCTKGNKEVKVVLEFDKGILVGISIKMANRRTKKLTSVEREKIRKFVEVYHKEIKRKWYDFRAGRPIKSITISKEIR